jgi:hypothetical protein
MASTRAHALAPVGYGEGNMVSLPPEPSEGSKASLSVQLFRKEASRIRRDAERVTGEEIRRQMLDIAAQYDVLAESEERQPR